MKVQRAIKLMREAQEAYASDPEVLHGVLDFILLESVHSDVRKAYEEIRKSCKWWVT